MARNLAQGRTAMLQLGDPLDYQGKVFMTLGQLFDDVRLQKLAMGVPCCPDYSKQEDKIVTHLAKLTRDKRNDTVRLPASVPEAKQVLNPSHPWYKYDDSARQCRRDRSSSRDGRMASSETESDPTQASVPESTDTEMYQALEKDLLISSDCQAGLVWNAAQVLDEVAGGVESTRDMCSIQFREPDEEEEEVRRIPGTRAERRGQSILKKETANTPTGATLQQPHTIDDVPSGVGSPLTKHLGNRVPSGDFSFRSGFQLQLKATYDSYTTLKQSYTNFKWSSSRKQEHQAQPKPLMDTPTQSPLQKTGWLQSVVTVVRKEQPKRDST